MNEEINQLIDQYNTVKAQNVALTHALASLLSILPDEIRDAIEDEYDIRCATFQSIVNDGKTELDALSTQREQFSVVRKRIFHL
ncbi:MAG: hypothetical protein Q7S46_03655 [Gallionella sp.]|nr:hypothetical protein [Gallionella sp.]